MSKIADPDDRVNLITRHARGPNVLPNFAFFTRLLLFAAKETKTIIRDLNAGVSANHVQLLTDAIYARDEILRVMDTETRQKLDSGQEVYIILLAPGSYEYVVGFLAIVTLGAAVVPIYTNLPVKEMKYYVQKTNASLMLFGSSCAKKAEELARTMLQSATLSSFKSVPLQCLVGRPTLQPADFRIDDRGFLDLNAPGLVIFTSGTTGPPKAAVRRRGYLSDGTLALASELGITKDDTLLHCLPVHHATGINVNILPILLEGGCIEFKPGNFDPAFVWNKFKEGELTVFSGVPTMYARLREYFDQNLASLPPEQLKPYVEGVQRLRDLWCGTSALPLPLQTWWTEFRQQRPILSRYGSTESALSIMTLPRSIDVPDNSVGSAVAGVDVKLSNGDEGEVLVRSPHMFSKYLGDPEATRKAHDADGFYKTGDIAEKRGNNYFILGRASIDIIKTGGYKVSALDVERALLGLPYVAEAMVVGVEDDTYGQRVGAAVVLRPGHDGATPKISLAGMRKDLRDSLVAYKMPTLLRVVPVLPKSPTGKVSKKILGPQLFSPQKAEPEKARL
ncbi:hypothetical protein M409DRAFT_22406 [Zasmidium cellare ATCC 36951]|uniref:AMP-dependent synthetase/ligase domain-containing protein n=1 Tax=Zasmidium cellare ATCC 36951 TaxID=1080233 RepID=A0A6A6CK57_ZASCE|nr:uncharacterized protein M409DRAFT_22406 [Zasmidium cellare ATCC 36951]KAF2167604.1 hypothetical protein M409DRAFT_22406 [Zasmidium cellare ATCC 36951]